MNTLLALIINEINFDMIDLSLLYFEQVFELQNILFICSICLCTFAALLGFNLIYQNGRNTLYSTKSVLSLFQTKFIIDNPYIMSYINQ